MKKTSKTYERYHMQLKFPMLYLPCFKIPYSETIISGLELNQIDAGGAVLSVSALSVIGPIDL